MDPISRRGFVGTLGAAVGAGCLPYTPVFANTAIEPERVVHTSGDGIGITPREYAALLNRLCQSKDVDDDNYLLGGEVEAFEKHWATAARQGDGGVHAVGHAGEPAGAARAGRNEAPRDRAGDEPHL